MAEQIKFGDRLFLKGAKVFLDSGPTDNAILETRSGTVEIAGNLVVQGSTTTVNSETVSVADPFMLLNGDHTGPASEDVGIEVNRGDDTNQKFGWAETSEMVLSLSQVDINWRSVNQVTLSMFNG